MLPGHCMLTKKVLWRNYLGIVSSGKCSKNDVCQYQMSGYCSMLWNMSEEIVGDVKPVRKIKKTLTCQTPRLGVVERFTLHPCSSIMLHCSSVQERWWKLLSHNKNRLRSIHPFFEQDDFVLNFNM